MEQLRILNQLHILAADILDVSFQIDKIFSSSKLLCHKQCAVFQSFVRSLVLATQEWSCMFKDDHRARWIALYEEELKSKCGMTLGKELVGVVKRGLQILTQCADINSPSSRVIILRSAGEFSEIIDDAKSYSHIMNHLMVSLGFQTVQHEVEVNFSNELITACEEDKNALMQDSPGNMLVIIQGLVNGHRNRIFKSFFLQMLEHPVPVTHNIAYSDIKIQKFLEAGGFGRVSKGLWCGEVPVAVKEFADDSDFQKEYEVLKKLTSANSFHIVQIFGHTEVEGKKALVMELMDDDLGGLIEKKNSPFSLEESIDIILPLARGIRSLHRDSVIHRDIKPSNIMVKHRRDGSLIVKLADFGTCKADFHTKSTHTEKKGTRMYMAPEMVAGKGKYSKMVDVYSFGILWIEMLRGFPPHIDMLPARHTLQLPDKDILFLPQGFHENVYMLIYGCLQLEAEQRYSFEEIYDQLWRLKKLLLIGEIEKMKLSFTIPQVSTPSGKKVIYSDTNGMHSQSSRLEGLDDLVDIELVALDIGQSGEPELMMKARLLLHRFKVLVIDHGKKFNLSFVICRYRHTILIESVLRFCKMYPIFNGLLFDTIHSELRQEDGEDFILMLEQLRSALPEGFMIGVISPTQASEIKWPIESEKAIQLIDRIQLCSEYTPASPSKHIAQHIFNLYSSSHQSSSVDETVNMYISKGVHSSKIFLDCGHYEEIFSNTDGIGKPATEMATRLVRDLNGQLRVNFTCNNQNKDKGFVEKWDDEAKAPYGYNSGRKTISVYDNVQSIIEKAEYIKAKDLGGILIGRCDAGVKCLMFKALCDNLTHL